MQRAPDPLVSLTDAALVVGVHKSTLSRQVKAGAVRSHRGKVRVSEVIADRAANLRPSPASRAALVAAPNATRQPRNGARNSTTADDEPGETLSDAQRRKEIALADKHEIDVRQRRGDLVERSAAIKLFFDTARANRDAWLNWPARVAITMADELKVDARLLNQCLDRQVQQHLAEMGEPEGHL